MTNKAQAVPTFFSVNASEYERKQYLSGKRTFINVRHAHVLQLIKELQIPGLSRILDAGCGPGFLTRDLLARHYIVHSVDVSEQMLEVAANNGGGLFKGKQGSIEALPYEDNSFDVVCSCGVIEYLPSYEKAIKEFHRVLAPGGILILSTTNPRAPATYTYPLMEMAKRLKIVQRLFDTKPRDFKVTYHSPSHIKKSLGLLGFKLVQERFFYLLPLPRPFDIILPFTRRIEQFMERFGNTPIIRHIGEGHLSVVEKS